MKGQRGKKAKYEKYAEKGLLDDSIWKKTLRRYPTDLIEAIRQRLKAEIPHLNEKFNTIGRYFGYYKDYNEDRLYIYACRDMLIVDLSISEDLKSDLEARGFIINLRDNFQAKKGWLTGWQCPNPNTDIETVMKWICKAFINPK